VNKSKSKAITMYRSFYTFREASPNSNVEEKTLFKA